ncbi:MAG: hypothetical protein ACRC6A_01510 [Fusobacteriaceae bacterium]
MLNQKKYFKINLMLFLFGVFLIFILGMVQRYKIDENNRFLRVPKNLKIINLGSSHGLSNFVYPKGTNAYNLGFSAQVFFYDEAILRKYKSNLQSGGIVIIPISIFSFYKVYTVVSLSENDYSQNYYSFLDYTEIYKGNKNQQKLKKYFPLLYNGNDLKFVIKYFITNVLRGDFTPKKPSYPNDLSLEEKKVQADSTSLSHLAIDKYKDNNMPEIAMLHFKNIINICKENNLTPILITTPQTYLYNERIGENNYEERIYSKIKKVNELFQNELIYLDYSHDKRFENNLDLFSDDDHLNKKGAEIFTKIVLEDLGLTKDNQYIETLESYEKNVEIFKTKVSE